MNPIDNLTPEDRQRTEAAAAWWTRIQNDQSAELSPEFREWVTVPLNDRAFQAVESAMSQLDIFGVSSEILDMRRSAIGEFQKGGSRHWLFRKAAYVAAAAILLVSVASATYYLRQASQRLSYRTEMGERRSFVLTDGSRISLDSNSEVDIRYSKTARAIVLTQGRARFDVAHDMARPFSVTAASETVVAVGTSFDVELRISKVLVTLIQGHVLIKYAPNGTVHFGLPKIPVSLSAGQQLVTSVGHKPVVVPADFLVTQAWEGGHLVFRGERLADAVEQVNNYTDHPIVVDPSVASIRISGVFNTGDTKSFVSAITGYFPVEATAGIDDMITLQKRP